MEVREILSFLKLAATGSILETAAQCNLTPGAVHKHLKLLEEELCVRLYEKRNGRLEITEHGEAVLPYLRAAIAQIEAATRVSADWGRTPHGKVRIGAGPAFSSQLLPGLLSKFRQQYSEVEFYVENGHGNRLIQGILEGSLDLAFELELAARDEPRLKLAAAWDAPIGFITSDKTAPHHCRLEDLESLPFVLFEEGSRMDRVIQTYFDVNHFRPKVVMRSDNAEAIKSVVQSGLGVGMMFLWCATHELRSGQLHHIFILDKAPLTAQMALITQDVPYLKAALSAFIATSQTMDWDYLVPVNLVGSKLEYI